MTELTEKLKNALEAKGYSVNCFGTKEEAAAFLDRELDGKVIGIGGSRTVEQLGLYPLLAAHNEVYWHARKPEGMTETETRHAASRAQVYLSSVNAVSAAGEIVNIDGSGNRTAAISYGPEDVYLLIGRNKITADLASAVSRARNIAAPLNARRLNVKTPCAVRADKCYDCSSPERICRIFSVLTDKPFGAAYHAVLINEDLGF